MAGDLTHELGKSSTSLCGGTRPDAGGAFLRIADRVRSVVLVDEIHEVAKV
jgi:hypothetical protein